MSDTTTLIEALKAAGHQEQADQLRDTEFAKQLREAGHEDVASALEGKRNGPAPPQEEPPTEAQQFVDELRAAVNKNTVSIPGLLDR